ncbi:MAG TPA: cation transporter, partial [Alphaproteobacteria bacterium]|nr:cation transporter [Alphaproteobacteria bacterium]
MAACCTHSGCSKTNNSPAWRRALWIALTVNASMFCFEIAAGVAAGSTSLQADALDFFGDAFNYAVSLGVAGLALGWRARAAIVKGATLGIFGLWVLGTAMWHSLAGTVPEAQVMGAIGVLALLANVGVAAMLFRFRTGDANMRSVWICSRNDAIGNVAVVLA